jgi:hypothetical protein
MTRPVFHTLPEFKELNAELRTLILKNKARSNGIKATNMGAPGATGCGWHSEYFTDECEHPAVQRLLSQIQEVAPDGGPWRFTMLWANVNERGHYNRLHKHGAHAWSGYYVVDAGNGSGRTVFPSEDLAIAPENGLLAFFRANLEHSVEEYTGESLRITVAFNLKAAT